MSRYVLLVLINIPLLLVGIVSALTSYNTRRISKKRCIAEVIFWFAVGVGMLFVEPLYNTLVRYNLTNSTPMSLFDMLLLTLILFCLLLIKSTNERTAYLHKKISRMHENVVITEAHRNQKS
jgi:drug/metabolite transporter (DMT)-like permease